MIYDDVIVEIFDSDSIYDLQTKINSFLKGKIIVDIKFIGSSIQIPSNLPRNNYAAMIMWRKRD